MSHPNLTEQIRVVSLAASEVVEEPDTIARRPDVLTILTQLSQSADFPALFASGNGHIPSGDPAAYVAALADALALYVDTPLDDAPELVEGLATVASVMREAVAQGAMEPPASAAV